MVVVDDVRRRLAALPLERRHLLERLLAVQGHGLAAAPWAAAEVPPADGEQPLLRARDGLLNLDGHNEDQIKAMTRRFYDTISRQLNAHLAGEHALFLNYGYVADGSPEYAAVALPARCLNRNATKLVLEVVGNCQLAGCSILDVGCGRGGLLATLARYFAVGELVGLDLSAQAIAFCRSAHRGISTFVEGDAEALPFDDRRFDAVTNVESSHNYPHVDLFYREVYRVLRPDGVFLYTDAFPADRVAGHLEVLQRLGFGIEHDRDITTNVLLSCDQTAHTHMAAFDEANDAAVMRAFLATPDSPTYQALRDGRSTYRILRLRKVGAAA